MRKASGPRGGELVTCVDVWLGGAVKRADLRIPPKAAVDPGLEVRAREVVALQDPSGVRVAPHVRGPAVPVDRDRRPLPDDPAERARALGEARALVVGGRLVRVRDHDGGAPHPARAGEVVQVVRAAVVGARPLDRAVDRDEVAVLLRQTIASHRRARVHDTNSVVSVRRFAI